MSERASANDLALQIRTELSDAAPQGFLFTDHVIRQDQALERLAERLKEHADAPEVDAAVSRAVESEKDGWTLLKLLELIERLNVKGAAGHLIQLAGHPPGEDQRSRFLAGRACEVLLKLPLDLETRSRANAVCKGPLEEIHAFRTGAAKERAQHRPRTVEWTLLAILMAVALSGLVFAWFALGR